MDWAVLKEVICRGCDRLLIFYKTAESGYCSECEGARKNGSANR